MQPSNNRSTQKILAVVAIVVVAALAVFGISAFDKDTTNTETTTNSSTDSTANPTTTSDATPTTQDQSQPSEATTYKDGTYEVTQIYATPGGSESFTTSVTIANNTITNTSFTPRSKSSDSKEYQRDFNAGYKSKIIGKVLEDLNISRVSGASLTTGAFNDALAEIRNQANS